MNRIVQWMKYCGETFSGHKAILCADEFSVVGHRCSYRGRIPSPDKIHVIMNWGPCEDLSDVRSFLGTTGIFRMFIKDYGKKAGPLTELMKLNVAFTWGDAQEKTMKELKDSVQDASCLKPIDYSWDSEVILAVDGSYRGAGFIIYQCDPKNPKK